GLGGTPIVLSSSAGGLGGRLLTTANHVTTSHLPGHMTLASSGAVPSLMQQNRLATSMHQQQQQHHHQQQQQQLHQQHQQLQQQSAAGPLGSSALHHPAPTQTQAQHPAPVATPPVR